MKALTLEEAKQLKALLDRAVGANQVTIGKGLVGIATSGTFGGGHAAKDNLEVKIIDNPCTDTGNDIEIDINLSLYLLGILANK